MCVKQRPIPGYESSECNPKDEEGVQNQNSRSRYGIEIQTFLRSPPLSRLPECHQMPRSGRHLPPQHIGVAILGADLIKGIVWAIPLV